MSVGESFLYQGSKHIFSKILGAISKKLQLKFFPLDLKKFLVEFKVSSSSLSLNFESNSAVLYLAYVITNHTAYELLWLGTNIRINIENSFHKSIDKIAFEEVKVDFENYYTIEIPLTYFEAKQLANNTYQNNQAYIELNITFFCHSIFGLKRIDVVKRERIGVVVRKA